MPSSNSSTKASKTSLSSTAAPGASSTSTTHHGTASKLPKFLQKQGRDRSKSVNDHGLSASSSGIPSTSSSASNHLATSSSSSSTGGFTHVVDPSSATTANTKQSRRGSKLKGVKETREGKTDSSMNAGNSVDTDDFASMSMAHGEDMPIIVEPSAPVLVPAVRPRTRSERPLSATSADAQPYMMSNTSSPGARLSDLPTRLSGWFSHTFSSSATDLSLPALLSSTHSQASIAGASGAGDRGSIPGALSMSPKSKANALFTAAKHGKGHLDKAMRYLLDSDATPDKCPDPIWLLGVQHPGYEAPASPPAVPVSPSSPNGYSSSSSTTHRRGSTDHRLSSASFRSTASRSNSRDPNAGYNSGYSSSEYASAASGKHNPGAYWPPLFYADFTTRIWLTYRSHFVPIKEQPLSCLLDGDGGSASSNSSTRGMDPNVSQSSQVGNTSISGSPPNTRRWNWSGVIGGGEKGWTSDAGWGCMLRTGQSLLANSLIHLYLGRDWRRPLYPSPNQQYATYVKILTWFLDSPDPACPFSVHRMALAGKELGKDVGQWFGPSTAAGAIKTLVTAFPESGLGVAIALDGVLYETDVLAASNPHPYRHHRRSAYSSNTSNNRRRNRYSKTHQAPFSWGGRPVLVLIGIRLGINGVNPVYYEALKSLFTFHQSVGIAGGRPSSSYYFVGAQADSLFYLDPHHVRPAIPLRPVPSHLQNEKNEQELHQPRPQSHLSPSMQQQISSSSSYSYVSSHTSPSVTSSPIASPTPSQSPSLSSPDSPLIRGATFGQMPTSPYSGELDPVQEHYATAYAPNELKTYHCEKVRKLPLSGMDPSMLLGFLCKDENDWKDLRQKVAELSRIHKTIFTIQDEPPSWPSDSDDMGLQSVSDVEVDMDEPDEEGELDGDAEGDQSNGVLDEQAEDEKHEVDRKRGSVRNSEDASTEDDPPDPVTPGAHETSWSASATGASSGFVKLGSVSNPSAVTEGEEDNDADDGEEEWYDPMESTSPPILPGAMSERTASLAGSDTTQRRSVRRSGASSTNRTPSATVSRPQVQEYFPFPVVDDRDEEDIEEEVIDDGGYPTMDKEGSGGNGSDERLVLVYGPGQPKPNSKGPRIRTARARDGGRTQSGGVRGIITSDLEDGEDN